MLLLTLLPVAHVPTYSGGCDDNCCHPPHAHTTSQVVYLKGEGGLELDLADVREDEVVDFNVVFKKRYDMSTFELYVGCGGCASADALLSDPFVKPDDYQGGELEPFTQTSYFPLLAKGEARQFNTTLLDECTSNHWTIRLVTYPNATETIVWGAVVGCDGWACEVFTDRELVSFPLYILRNHGAVWNGYGWTIFFSVIIALLLMVAVISYCFGGSKVLMTPVVIDDFRCEKDEFYFEQRQYSLRAILYAIAILAFSTDLVELWIHFFIAMTNIGWVSNSGIWLFLGLVVGLSRIGPMILVGFMWFWHHIIFPRAKQAHRITCSCEKDEGLSWTSPLWALDGWCFVDLAFAGVLFVYGLGSGLWVAPAALSLAGLVRLYDFFSAFFSPGEQKPLDCKQVRDEEKTSLALLPAVFLSEKKNRF
jgi:hypothetical protein